MSAELKQLLLLDGVSNAPNFLVHLLAYHLQVLFPELLDSQTHRLQELLLQPIASYLFFLQFGGAAGVAEGRLGGSVQPGELLQDLAMFGYQLVVALYQALLQIQVLVGQLFADIVEFLVEFEKDVV